MKFLYLVQLEGLKQSIIKVKKLQKKLQGIYKNGIEDGIWIDWYENGQKESETNWNNVIFDYTINERYTLNFKSDYKFTASDNSGIISFDNHYHKISLGSTMQYNIHQVSFGIDKFKEKHHYHYFNYTIIFNRFKLFNFDMSPNRSEFRRAIGLAAIEKMSRTIPPIPVAAPCIGSIADGWLCDSIFITIARLSPISIAPAFSEPCPINTL